MSISFFIVYDRDLDLEPEMGFKDGCPKLHDSISFLKLEVFSNQKYNRQFIN